MLDIKATLLENNIIKINMCENNMYDNEELFDTIICECIGKKGRKSIFSMINDEKDLSIFVIHSYIKHLHLNEIIEKKFGKKLDNGYLDFLYTIVIFELYFESEKNQLLKKGDNNSITLPMFSVKILNTNGFEFICRSSFEAEMKKSSNKLKGEYKANGLSCITNNAIGLFYSGKSVCFYTFIELTAITIAMHFVLFVRKYLYSEKLIL